jgi:hypothetical protein
MHAKSFLSSLAYVAIGTVAMSLASPASAALVNTSVPANAFINFNGLDWAWAFPLPADQGLDLSFQAPLGWRLPTLAEIGAAPDAVDFLFPGANVPFSGADPVSGASFQATNANYMGDGACATPYFSSSSSYSHCDWVDGQGQPNQPWAGLPGAFGFADQLVVRDTTAPPPAVPGPLPSLGVAVALGYSRKLRVRIKAGR